MCHENEFCMSIGDIGDHSLHVYEVMSIFTKSDWSHTSASVLHIQMKITEKTHMSFDL